MDILSYINEMVSRDSIYTNICLYLLIGFGAFVAIGMLIGFARGAYRQAAHTTTFLATAILSYAAVKLLIGKFIELLNVETIGDALSMLESFTGIDMSALYSIILGLDMEGIEGFLILPATVIVAPLAFVGIFLIFRFILAIVSSLLIRIFRVRRAKGLLERFGGMCLGAVETVLFASVFLLPITSVAGFFNDAYTVIIEDDSDSASAVSGVYDEYLMPLAEHPILDIAGRSANTIICASFTDNRSGIDAKNEIFYTIRIAATDIPKLTGIDYSAMTEDDKAVIDGVIYDIEQSDFTTNVIASVVKNFSKIFEWQSEANLFPPPFDTLFGDFLTVLSSTTKETVAEDLRVIKDLLVFLSDNLVIEAISNDEDILPVLTAKNPDTGITVINGIIELMKNNERTKPLVTSITKLSLSLLTDNITADSEQLTSIYENVKSDITDLLSTDESDYATKKEYIDALTDRLDEGLKNNGIELEDSMVRSIAEYVDENFSDKTEITEEEFNDAILSFYSEHADAFESVTLPDNFSGDLSDLNGLLGN